METEMFNDYDELVYLQECQDEKFELANEVVFQYNYKTEMENEVKQ